MTTTATEAGTFVVCRRPGTYMGEALESGQVTPAFGIGRLARLMDIGYLGAFTGELDGTALCAVCGARFTSEALLDWHRVQRHPAAIATEHHDSRALPPAEAALEREARREAVEAEVRRDAVARLGLAAGEESEAAEAAGATLQRAEALVQQFRSAATETKAGYEQAKGGADRERRLAWVRKQRPGVVEAVERALRADASVQRGRDGSIDSEGDRVRAEYRLREAQQALETALTEAPQAEAERVSR